MVSVCIDKNEDERKVMNELVQRANQRTNESTDKMYVVRGAYHPYIREMNKFGRSCDRQGVYSKNEFKVFYTNCDCLTKSKINDLECSTKLINLSIICLTEVLPKNIKLEYNKEMYNLTGYVIVDSLLKGRGICLYCKPEFKYNVIKNISEFEEAVACEFTGQTEILLFVIWLFVIDLPIAHYAMIKHFLIYFWIWPKEIIIIYCLLAFLIIVLLIGT